MIGFIRLAIFGSRKTHTCMCPPCLMNRHCGVRSNGCTE